MSKALNGLQLVAGARFTPPANVAPRSSSLIYGLVTYRYVPRRGDGVLRERNPDQLFDLHEPAHRQLHSARRDQLLGAGMGSASSSDRFRGPSS